MDLHSARQHDERCALREALASLVETACGDHGAAAPTLTAVTIEPEPFSSDLCMRLHFSNGYDVSRVLCRRDVRPFCVEHGIRTRAKLEDLLLEEALPICERMREFDPEEKIAGEEIVDEESAAFFEVGTPAAREKGMRLLFLRLTPLQRRQLSKKGYFEVIGGDSGHCYRIWRGRIMNVDQLDRRGRRVCSWCFYPKGRVVTGDVMLAQKLALELDEKAALRIAGRERSRSRTPRAGAADELLAPADQPPGAPCVLT